MGSSFPIQGSVPLGSPTEKTFSLLIRRSAIKASTIADDPSFCLNTSSGVSALAQASGQCITSAALYLNVGSRIVSVILSAISRAGPNPNPRPITNAARAAAKLPLHADQSQVSASRNLCGSCVIFWLKAWSEVSDAISCRPTTIDNTTDFVAATERSGPAPIGSVNSQAKATGDVTSFTIAIVSALLFLADSAPATRSGLRPDCDMTMKRASCISIDCL